MRVGDGRLASITWLPASSVFRHPESVIWNRSRRWFASGVCDFHWLKNRIQQRKSPSIQYPGYSGHRGEGWRCFSKYVPLATAADITCKIAYFENMYWVMIYEPKIIWYWCVKKVFQLVINGCRLPLCKLRGKPVIWIFMSGCIVNWSYYRWFDRLFQIHHQYGIRKNRDIKINNGRAISTIL